MARLFARLDAVQSSAAEGTTSTFQDVISVESSLRRAADPLDAASVLGIAHSLDELGERAERRFSPDRAARLAHALVFPSGAGRWLGYPLSNYKTIVNGTGDNDTPGGWFFFAKPDQVQGLMAEWARFTVAGGPMPQPKEFSRQALSHWMFEQIHPFPDGNGRVGRLLFTRISWRQSITETPSAFFGEAVRRDKDQYIEGLKQARRTGDFAPWVRLMAVMLESTAEQNLRRLDELDALSKQWRQALRYYRSRHMIHDLLGFAFSRPAFSIADATNNLARGTFASINNAAAELVALGILKAAGHEQRNRLFLCPAVLRVFS